MTQIRAKSATKRETVAKRADNDGMVPGCLPKSSRLANILTSSELTSVGITAAQRRALIRSGVLVPLGFRGVYAQAPLGQKTMDGPAADRALRVAAAVAVVGKGAAGSHHDAALLHGLDLLRDPSSGGMVAVTRPLDAPGSRTGRPGIRIHNAMLPDSHVTVSQGIRVTSVARTVVDLARISSFTEGVIVADSALRQRLTCEDELRRVMTNCVRWPGVTRAKRVIEFSDGRAESAFESIARVAFHDGGLPPPDLQVWVGGDDGVIGRADFLWRAHHTIAEADGAMKYADPDRARRQLQRDADLRAAGYEVVHFTWRDLMKTPHQVIRAIEAAFVRAAALRR
jgi:hypothetical protein